jgi:hypothetical protein
MQACRADTHQYCQQVARGGGRILACLKSHESQLSDACKSAVARQPSSATQPVPSQ